MFTQTSGSTLGTLIATGLLSASRATKGRTDILWTELPSLLQGAIEEMKRRGKGEFGDKTVLDALEAIRVSIAGLSEPGAMLDAAKQSVASAVQQFRDQPSRQGRARILAERSVGRDDPGMVAIQRLVEGLRTG